MKVKTNILFSILLCMTMLFSLVPMTVFADDSRSAKTTDESKSEKITDESKAEKITTESKAEKTTNASTTEKVTEDSNSSKITKDSEKITDEAKFISLEEARKIALKDAELDRNKQKITFTKAELNHYQGRP